MDLSGEHALRHYRIPQYDVRPHIINMQYVTFSVKAGQSSKDSVACQALQYIQSALSASLCLYRHQKSRRL